MNIPLSSVMLKRIDELYRSGLYGESHEDVARRLIEERIRELIADRTLIQCQQNPTPAP